MTVTGPDELRAAADEVERLAADTTPGPWTVHHMERMHPNVAAEIRAAGGVILSHHRAGDGAWVEAFGPQIGPLVAGLLRAVAEGPTTDVEVSRHAARLAQAILNGRASAVTDEPVPTGQAFLDAYCTPELADPPLTDGRRRASEGRAPNGL